MLKVILLSFLSFQAHGAYSLCQNEEMVIRFEGERIFHVSGKGHEFKVENPKIEIFSNKTTYLGKVAYKKDFGNRTARLSIKKNGSATLVLEMANRAPLTAKLTCK